MTQKLFIYKMSKNLIFWTNQKFEFDQDFQRFAILGYFCYAEFWFISKFLGTNSNDIIWVFSASNVKTFLSEHP